MVGLIEARAPGRFLGHGRDGVHAMMKPAGDEAARSDGERRLGRRPGPGSPVVTLAELSPP
jgi:hypothetical protein